MDPMEQQDDSNQGSPRKSPAISTIGMAAAAALFFLGILLDRTDLSEGKKKMASLFALGALLEPLGIILGAFWGPLFLVYVARLGTTCLLITACFMATAFYYPEVRRK